MTQIVLVAAGSALGGLTRWGVGLLAARLLGARFPFGTFLINVTGCFFLGWFATVLSQRLISFRAGWLGADELRLFFAVGFAGAYTTFSTFGYEADNLMRSGEGFASTIYIAGSVLGGLLAVRAGVLLATWH